MRFRLRGYRSDANAVYLNRIDFTGLDNGFTPFGLWGGLNNVMRSRETSYGLDANGFAIGNVRSIPILTEQGCTMGLNTVGYAHLNRNYRHRFTFLMVRALIKDGLIVALSPCYNSYVPGTYYRGLSYYAAADKK